ncbi:MAG: hypothetical protein NC307_03225 [Roseburia sp.]|nr:hypothetical protein [Roseburia sp.]
MDIETKEDLKAYVKEQGRIEKEKLKTMTIGEKIEYIWMYYKAQIIIVALVMAFVISLVHHLIVGSKESILYSMVLNSNALQSDDTAPPLYTDFLMEKGYDPKEYKVDYHTGLNVSLDEYGEVSDMQIFSVVATLLMSGTVDHIMTNEEVVVMLGEIGYIMPLEECLPPEKIEEYDREGKVIYGSHPDTKEKTAFGVSLAESEKVKGAELFSFSPVYAMIYGAPHLDNSAQFLYYLEP